MQSFLTCVLLRHRHRISLIDLLLLSCRICACRHKLILCKALPCNSSSKKLSFLLYCKQDKLYCLILFAYSTRISEIVLHYICSIQTFLIQCSSPSRKGYALSRSDIACNFPTVTSILQAKTYTYLHVCKTTKRM